jgi:hypothetical protein
MADTPSGPESSASEFEPDRGSWESTEEEEEGEEEREDEEEDEDTEEPENLVVSDIQQRPPCQKCRKHHKKAQDTPRIAFVVTYFCTDFIIVCFQFCVSQVR